MLANCHHAFSSLNTSLLLYENSHIHNTKRETWKKTGMIVSCQPRIYILLTPFIRCSHWGQFSTEERCQTLFSFEANYLTSAHVCWCYWQLLFLRKRQVSDWSYEPYLSRHTHTRKYTIALNVDKKRQEQPVEKDHRARDKQRNVRFSKLFEKNQNDNTLSSLVSWATIPAERFNEKWLICCLVTFEKCVIDHSDWMKKKLSRMKKDAHSPEAISSCQKKTRTCCMDRHLF